MIEIRTQEQFNNINNTIKGLPTEGESIRIYALKNDKEYILSTPILIDRNNVILEGYGVNKPKIKSNITDIGEEKGSMIYVGGTSEIELENITVKNLHLIGNDENNGGCSGIVSNYVGKAYINKSNAYDGSLTGVDKITKKGITIKDCAIKNNRSQGISLSNSSNSIITGNMCCNNANGIYLKDSSVNTITSNTSNNNICGFALFSSLHNNILGNISINHRSQGVYLALSSSNSITGNTIDKNKGHGIELNTTSKNNSIVGNTITNNDNGINVFNYSSVNTITSNTSNNNMHIGINVDANSSDNTITGNGITKNSIGIKTKSDCTDIMIYSNIVQDNATNYAIASTGKFDMNYNI